MKEQPIGRLVIHPIIRAIILGGIAFYIARLQLTGHLTLYIAPRMTIYVKLAAIALYGVAVVQLYQAFRIWNGKEDNCGCEHPPSPSILRNLFVYGLFIVPLAVFIFSPDTTIGSAMAAQKGMTLSTSGSIKNKEKSAGASTPTQAAAAAASPGGATDANQAPHPTSDGAESASPGLELEKLFPADEFTEAYSKYGMELYKKPLITVTEKNYMEILTTIDLYLDNFVGKKMTLEGFVYRDETLEANQFILGRFAVQCCTADALPYGVLVDEAGAGAFGSDTWLRMTGTIQKTQYNGTDVILFKADKSEKIKPSDDPYVYPDYDFGL